MAKIECGVESAHHGATYCATQANLHVDSFQCEEPHMYVDGLVVSCMRHKFNPLMA